MKLYYKMLAWLMGLFRKPTRTEHLLSYNIVDLKTKIERKGLELYSYKSEDSWKLLKEILMLARNIQVLEVNLLKTKDEKYLAHQQGRLEAINDLINYLDLIFDAQMHGELLEKNKDKRKNVRVFDKKASNLASREAVI